VATVVANRSRAGNAMAKARAGILAGARASLVDGGIKAVTMSGVADRGGVAKATVYNHFRTKQDVLAAVALAEIDEAAETAWPWLTRDLATALVTAAQTLAASPVVRAVIDRDPGVAASVFPAAEGPGGPCRDHAAALVADALETADHAASAVNVDLTLRWLAAVAVSPPHAALLQAQAQLLVGTLRS
jgi:AcrR family transcriptional regulator